MKLKKGSLEAKKFMAKIRAKKGASKKVSGVKYKKPKLFKPTKKETTKAVKRLVKESLHTDKNSHNYKISISGVENLIKDRNLYEKMLKAKKSLINEHLKILKQKSLSKETQKNLKDLNIILKRQILSIKKEIKMLNSKITK